MYAIQMMILVFYLADHSITVPLTTLPPALSAPSAASTSRTAKSSNRPTPTSPASQRPTRSPTSSARSKRPPPVTPTHSPRRVVLPALARISMLVWLLSSVFGTTTLPTCSGSTLPTPLAPTRSALLVVPAPLPLVSPAMLSLNRPMLLSLSAMSSLVPLALPTSLRRGLDLLLINDRVGRALNSRPRRDGDSLSHSFGNDVSVMKCSFLVTRLYNLFVWVCRN
jgi:hypothetical protein